MAEPPWVAGKRAAHALRLELGLGFEPLDIWDVIRRRDVTFALHDFGLSGGDGLYMFSARGALIIVNAAKRASRQRFTAAHELGHHELHRFDGPEMVIADKDVLRSDGQPMEIAANAFAASLLAPTKGLALRLGDKRNSHVSADDVVGLMRRFGLSYEATVNCLNNASLVNKPNRERLLREAEGNKDVLVARAGFTEDEIYPPGSPLPPLHLSHAMALYQAGVVTPERLSELLDTSVETAVSRADATGYGRPTEPSTLHDDAAADLFGL